MTIRRLLEARLPFAADPRLLRVLATAGASYVGRFGAGIVVLVTVPMARASLPPELFGVWMMLTALLGFFSFADLGIGNGVLNGVTRARAADDAQALRRVLGSGYACALASGVLLLLAWCTWVALATSPVSVAGRISPANAPPVLAALSTFALLIAVNIPASLVQKAQLGSQQGHWIGITQFASALVALVAVPLILHARGPLYLLILATLGAQTLGNLASSAWWLRRNRIFAGASARDLVDAPTLRGLLHVGGQFFALQIAVAFAFQSDAIVITQRLGQAPYGDFAVVQKLFLFVSMLLNSALLGLWPAFGDAIARDDLAWAKRVLVRSLLVAASFASAASLALVLSIGWITTHWLRTSFAPPLSLCVALATWTVIEAMGSVSGVFMNGANLVRIQVVVALLMAAVAFGGKWMLVSVLGPTGSVLATIAAYCMIAIPGQFFVYRTVFAARK
ncbi:lipopolysaccharide biosynthesis protein [Scleromatobacter humisilvae]|uniref:Oligosaccharide flippase family protein n=1 Tax=Scleromatobacter humisilvae TaxID=2897159 RepID=A0A9X1YLF4_9BURK|nr:oligosaccharide flippase family protein [Scleromatobacter humisilvae]MCK9688328.1 oligosaccharide flippase family protein [Scleromatobacter humisilvae]